MSPRSTGEQREREQLQTLKELGEGDLPEFTLEQLDAHVADAEAQHNELSARLNAIARD